MRVGITIALLVVAYIHFYLRSVIKHVRHRHEFHVAIFRLEASRVNHRESPLRQLFAALGRFADEVDEIQRLEKLNIPNPLVGGKLADQRRQALEAKGSHRSTVAVIPRQRVEPGEPLGLLAHFVFSQYFQKEVKMRNVVGRLGGHQTLLRGFAATEFGLRLVAGQDHHARDEKDWALRGNALGRHGAVFHTVLARQLETGAALHPARRRPLIERRDVPRCALVDIHHAESGCR
mmetsp:Transcript_8834/g.21586  ORF Transcript_8834/g.21586 Transcript_8834/m.21586 type:complete len:234 (-) Transcript_8834:212-913(-)